MSGRGARDGTAAAGAGGHDGYGRDGGGVSGGRLGLGIGLDAIVFSLDLGASASGGGDARTYGFQGDVDGGAHAIDGAGHVEVRAHGPGCGARLGNAQPVRRDGTRSAPASLARLTGAGTSWCRTAAARNVVRIGEHSTSDLVEGGKREHVGRDDGSGHVDAVGDDRRNLGLGGTNVSLAAVDMILAQLGCEPVIDLPETDLHVHELVDLRRGRCPALVHRVRLVQQ